MVFPEVKERRENLDETDKWDHRETQVPMVFQDQEVTLDQKDHRASEVLKDQWDQKETWESDSQETRESLARKAPRVKRDLRETARSLRENLRTALPAHQDLRE